MIINIFCDASIDINSGTSCGGCLVTNQCGSACSVLYYKGRILPNSTNNYAEITAILVGVIEALRLRPLYKYNYPIFRLFSDSKISLYGLRDWLKNWKITVDENGNQCLISTSGTPVCNQQVFIEIFNIIVENNLYIELYHQRGHATGKKSKVGLDKARADFIKANKVTPEHLELDIEFLSLCNDLIDNYTRDAVKAYINKNEFLPGIELEGYRPIELFIRENMKHQYINCIDKKSIKDKSRHDFKGGYSQ